MEYSTRLKNARDRSQQLKRLKLQLSKCQNQHRPPQDVNTSSQFQILNKFSTEAVQTIQVAAPQPPSVIVKLQPQRSEQSSSQPSSFIVVGDQQHGPSRQLTFSRSTNLNHFYHYNFNHHHHQYQLPLSQNQLDLSASPANRVSPSQQISLHKSISGLLTPKSPFTGPPDSFKTINSYAVFPKQNIHHSTPHTPLKHIRKLSE